MSIRTQAIAFESTTPQQAMDSSLKTGVVLMTDEGDRCILRGDFGELRARRAASCLLAPAVQDRVLYCILPDAIWVLAVLEQKDPTARLQFAGDVQLSLPAGRLAVLAERGLSLTSPEELSLTAGTLRVAAGFTQLVLQRIRLFAEHCEGMLGRLFLSLRRSHRVVEQEERVQVRKFHLDAQEEVLLRSKEAIVRANGLAKIDGEQIHLG